MVMNSKILAQEITIATTATAIPTTALAGRKAIIIKNTGAATIYLGDSTVTTADGYPLVVNEAQSFNLGENVTLYGIVAESTETCRILEGI